MTEQAVSPAEAPENHPGEETNVNQEGEVRWHTDVVGAVSATSRH